MKLARKVGFLHIPRTGGTYLESLLQDMGPNYFMNFFGTPENQIQNKIGLIENIERHKDIPGKIKNNPNWQTCKLFSGHYSMNINKYLTDDCEIKYITILRDPIQRTTSFIKRVTSSRIFKNQIMPDSTSFDQNFWKNFNDYISCGNKKGLMPHERHGFSNYMTKAIAGLDLSSEDLTVDESVFLKAKSNLNNMVYVGSFENYKKTVMDILSLFDLNIPAIRYNELKISTIPQDTKEILTNLNQYDIRLHKEYFNE